MVASERQRDHLITPHGGTGPSSCACLVPDTPLITPHGDLEPSRRSGGPGARRRPHYPSWGSGTAGTPHPPSSASPAHYPSWGSGTIAGGYIGAIATTSLPLMGIWNAGGGDVPGRRRLLITPHGDLELKKYRDGRSPVSNSLPLMGIWNRTGIEIAGDRHGRSLPLMGIWNPAWVRTAPDIARYSLPLMGIWNARILSRIRETQSDSLPLMGIWNHSRIAHSSAPRTPHYPSWGSGTPSGPGHHRRQRHLITPHGDLELDDDAGAALPLPHLITPHGDLERCIAAATRVSAAASLPLMGIWNAPSRHSSTRRAHRLITPHGDLERRPRRPARWPRRGAHYPSWGSGTRFGLTIPRGLLRSLPLMGIWNELPRYRRHRSIRILITPHGDLEHSMGRSRSGHCPPHYPSWGSGTAARMDGRHSQIRLITPHGDLEHLDEPVVQLPDPQLITPHGDLERFDGDMSGSALHVSLPLMGIWNVMTVALRRAA